MIKLENVSFSYKNGDTILKDINVKIQKGEFICIIGKNGSGKSTLLKVIAGLLYPTKGKVFIEDFDTKKKENFLKIRKQIGSVFQNPETQLIFNDIKDEFEFTLKNLELDNIEKRILEAIEKVGMKDKIKEDLFEFSLGQKQRIVIAEAISKNPTYLLLDEPTTMIDSKGKQDIYNIIKKLHQNGYTIVYITNFLEEIMLADKIWIMEEKQIAEVIQKKELLKRLDVLRKYDIGIPASLQCLEQLHKLDLLEKEET